jgi:hypothetical protein
MKNLHETIAELEALEKGRTQGEWEWSKCAFTGGISGLYSGDNPVCVPNCKNDGDGGFAWFEDFLTREDEHFIVKAPTMMKVIREQQALLADMQRMSDGLMGVVKSQRQTAQALVNKLRAILGGRE